MTTEFRQLIGTEIEFTAAIDIMEAYPEKGMRATIENIIADDETHEHNDQVWRIVVNYEKFDSHNKDLETANYYGSLAKGQSEGPEYTAREVGLYKTVETLYFMPPKSETGEDNWAAYFTILSTAKSKLAERYAVEGNGKSYVEWLESLVVA